jgi:hypothetical protein
VKLTTHLRLVPRRGSGWSCTSTPPSWRGTWLGGSTGATLPLLYHYKDSYWTNLWSSLCVQYMQLSEYRRDIPATPRTFNGNNFQSTAKNIKINWLFHSFITCAHFTFNHLSSFCYISSYF